MENYGNNYRSMSNRYFYGQSTPKIVENCSSKEKLGMAYVPFQKWEDLFDPCKGLTEGTMFPLLNLEFCGVRGK